MSQDVPDFPDDPAVAKLRNALGDERALALWREVALALRIENLDAPNDRLRFGDALVAKGGVLEVIGRAIKVQALLRGAKAS